MEPLGSWAKINKDDLLRSLSGREGFILVIASGIPPVLFSNGKPLGGPVNLPAVMERVRIYSLSKFEALDFLHGELKLPEPETPGESPGEEAPQEVPGSVTLTLNLSLPPEVLVPVENGVVESVRHLFQRKKVVIQSISGSGKIRQGFAGANILLLRIKLEGYSTEEVDASEVAEAIKSRVERILGLKTTVTVEELKLKRVDRLPTLRIPRRSINFRGGRVLEVPLSSAGAPPKVDRTKLEMEVTKLLQEAGISEELLSIKDSEGKNQGVQIIENTITSELVRVNGITLNWINVTQGENGYELVLGISRTSAGISDASIVEAVKTAIKKAESEASARGLGGKFRRAYVVIEKDIY